MPKATIPAESTNERALSIVGPFRERRVSLDHGIFRSAADALVEIDHFTPVRPRIDPTDAAALRALEVCRDIVPIPFRQVVKFLCRPVMAARSLRRSHAIDEDRFEPGSLGA
jgi:hypothetical protein